VVANQTINNYNPNEPSTNPPSQITEKPNKSLIHFPSTKQKHQMEISNCQWNAPDNYKSVIQKNITKL
jgi:hypothetical protein